VPVPQDAVRYVENDVLPAAEALTEAEVEAIRARCAEEVERGIPRIVEAAPAALPKRRRLGQELYAGLLGQAFGFLHLYERTGAREQIELAARYLDVGLVALDRSGVPRPEEWISFHASGGASALAAVVYDRLGDAARSAQHLESYRQLAARAADPEFPSEDLLWGRGGFFFGAAFLRRALGEDSLPGELVVGPLEQMVATGRGHARSHAPELTPGPHGRPPLLYMNLGAFMFECFAQSLIGSRSRPARALGASAARLLLWVAERREGLSRRYDIGLVHGLAGNLYLMMHFPELLERLGASADVRASLDCLADCVEAERGMLEVLPSRHSEPGVFTDRVHWCNGTTGAVFLFARAYEVFGEAAYLEAARRAAEHVWRFGLLRKGNGICHGIAGNAYAFLTLYRVTSEKSQLDRALHLARFTWSDRVTGAQSPPERSGSLYEGRMGTLCFYLDCLDPERARFPAFEV
jgi:hypothetical protein